VAQLPILVYTISMVSHSRAPGNHQESHAGDALPGTASPLMKTVSALLRAKGYSTPVPAFDPGCDTEKWSSKD
jgi:hypothetical protein